MKRLLPILSALLLLAACGPAEAPASERDAAESPAAEGIPPADGSLFALLEPADGGGIQVCTAGKGSFSMDPFSGTAPDQPAFPVFRPAGPLEPGRENPNLSAPFGHWNFSDAAGNLLAEGMEFDRVGWFNGEKLAPVCKDGKWAYLDAKGNLVTDFVYDACWDSQWAFDENTREYGEISPCAAYSLTGGYAPVCREGKWGVIDETGREIVPTLYGGAAPYPGGAWLADGDVWRLFLF